MSTYTSIGTFCLTVLLIATSGCSTVRLAVYDYQKKYTTAREYHEREAAATNASKEVSAKQALIAKANNYIGKPYRYGSCDASKGFDCSGLVYHVAKSQEVILPRSSQSMASIGPHIPWKKRKCVRYFSSSSFSRANTPIPSLSFISSITFPFMSTIQLWPG